MKHLILIGTLFLSLSTCGQIQDKEIESILHGCLIESYKNHEVDINKELSELENYLIENKFLKSSTGQGYYDFYKEIIRLNDTPSSIDYDRFENIYKLTPSEFYKANCLEKLKGIDTSAIATSKYYQLTLEIQKASSAGMTLSNIANAITRVLIPADFDNPYFRAMALLTIAYTSKSDKGLIRQLEHNINEDYSAYEIITVATTEMNQIILNGKPVSQEELYSRLIDFIEANPSNQLIQLQTKSSMSYDFYLKVQDQITSVYNDLRNDLAQEKFNKPYKELTENDQKEIRRVYPIRIKEQVD